MSRFTHSVSEPHTGRFVSAIYQAMERTRRPAFFTPTRTVSWMDWLGIIDGLVERFESFAQARMGILFRSSEISYACSWLFRCSREISSSSIKRSSDEAIEDLAASMRST